jgi:hypothetical protein
MAAPWMKAGAFRARLLFAVATDGSTAVSGLTASANKVFAIAPSFFGGWTNIGMLTFTASGGPGSYSGTGAPGVAFTGAANVGGELDVTYTYVTAVSEPPTLALAGAALIGLASVFRIRGAGANGRTARKRL